jgi:hypothetical protein
MELLSKATLKDHAHHLVAFLFTVICGALGALAVQNVRTTILVILNLADLDYRGSRLANTASWYVLGVLWAIYVLAIIPSHHGAVTRARVLKARAQAQADDHARRPPAEIADRPLLRWLWQHDLHLAALRFLRHLAIPAAILVVFFIIDLILLI